MSSMRQATGILLLFIAPPAASFTGTPKNRISNNQCNQHGRRETRLRGTVNFEGLSNADLHVVNPPNASPSRTLPEFLFHQESNAVLLGTDDYFERSDDLWDCRQPSVKWFGLDLVPVFVNKIDRNTEQEKDHVVVTIVDARTDITGQTKEKKQGNIISQVMEKSTFVGKNSLSFSTASSDDGKGWTLSSDFSLTLKVPLPRFLPLPPGFNAIGSRIVRTTCSARVQKNLNDVRDAYLEWASLPATDENVEQMIIGVVESEEEEAKELTNMVELAQLKAEKEIVKAIEKEQVELITIEREEEKSESSSEKIRKRKRDRVREFFIRRRT